MSTQRALLFATLLAALAISFGGQASAGGLPVPTPPCIPYVGC